MLIGLEIAHSSDGTYVNQRKYTLDILNDVVFLGANLLTPLPKGHKFTVDNSLLLDDPDGYLRLVGRLFLPNRPNIAYAVEQLRQFVDAPSARTLRCYYLYPSYLKIIFKRLILFFK